MRHVSPLLLIIYRVLTSTDYFPNPVLVSDDGLKRKLVTKFTSLLQGIRLSARSCRVHTKVLQVANLIRIASDCIAGEQLVSRTQGSLRSKREARGVRLYNAEARQLLTLTAPNPLGLT